MSFPVGPGDGRAGPTRRPGPVTAAATIMILMAVVGLVNVVIGLAGMDGIVDRFRSAAARTDADQADIDGLVVLVRATAVIAAIIGVTVAVLLVVLALGNLRGSNAARIATWVVSGLGLICGCCTLGAVVGQRGFAWAGDDPVAADLMRALADSYPSWWVGLNGGLSAAQALGYLVVALLLTLPTARAFFRRRPQAQWQPPIPPHAPPRPPL